MTGSGSRFLVGLQLAFLHFGHNIVRALLQSSLCVFFVFFSSLWLGFPANFFTDLALAVAPPKTFWHASLALPTPSSPAGIAVGKPTFLALALALALAQSKWQLVFLKLCPGTHNFCSNARRKATVRQQRRHPAHHEANFLDLDAPVCSVLVSFFRSVLLQHHGPH
jgi:hypothetical protein